MNRTISDAASYLARVLQAIGVPPIGFTHKPDLGPYKLAGPVPQPLPVSPFFVGVRYRRGKRVDPIAERKRVRGNVA